MSTFIGSTIGLECNGNGKVGKLVKVEFSRTEDGGVMLSAVSGRNLSSLNARKRITAEQFEARPRDPYDKVPEARWALGMLGFVLMSEDIDCDSDC